MMRQLIPDCTPITGPVELEGIYALPAGQGHVRVNLVSSLDGAVEVGGRSGALANADDKAAFMAMRAVTDVILVGAGTVRAERYGPVQLDPDVAARRMARGDRALPRLAIVTARGGLDPEARVFSGPDKPLLITTDWVLEHHPELAQAAQPIPCGATDVDLHSALDGLRALGVHRVLCEGGPTLFRSLLGADVLDELCVSVAPLLAGPGHTELTGQDPLAGVQRLRLHGLLEGEGMLLARYSRAS